MMHDLSKFLLGQFQTQNSEVNNSQASYFKFIPGHVAESLGKSSANMNFLNALLHKSSMPSYPNAVV